MDKYFSFKLKKLLLSLEENGVRIKKEKVNRFEDFASNYDLVFNCTGLGSKDLCQDSHLIPVRGQVEKVMIILDSNDQSDSLKFCTENSVNQL